MPLRAAAALLLALSGCTSVSLGRHIAATDYTGQPRRMIVIERLDKRFDPGLPAAFAAAIGTRLSECGVTAEVVSPQADVLDAEAKAMAAAERFKPDTLLNIRQAVRTIQDGETRGGSYLVSLRDLTEKREVWRGQLGMGSGTRLLTDRSGLGARFATELVQALAKDGLLKNCPMTARS